MPGAPVLGQLVVQRRRGSAMRPNDMGGHMARRFIGDRQVITTEQLFVHLSRAE